jgi:putative transposase
LKVFQGRLISRECLGIEVAQGIKGDDMVNMLDYIKSFRGAPRVIRCDSGPEFVSKVLD